MKTDEQYSAAFEKLKQAYLSAEPANLGASWEASVMRMVRNVAAQNEADASFAWRLAWSGSLASAAIAAALYLHTAGMGDSVLDLLVSGATTNQTVIEEFLLL